MWYTLYINANTGRIMSQETTTENMPEKNADQLDENVDNVPSITAKNTPEMTESQQKAEILKKKVFDEIVARKMKDDGLSQEDAEAEATEIFEKAMEEKKKRMERANFNDREFEHDFLQLFLNEPFLGTISMQVAKRPDYGKPTAYVGVRPNGKTYDIVMGYNPEFMRALSPTERQGVIRHEMYHLVFQHVFGRAPADGHYAILWNWATDLAINSIIGEKNLPDLCLIPGKEMIDPKTGEPQVGPYAEFIKNAKKMESSDFYFQELRKIEEEENKNGNSNSVQIAMDGGMGTMDDHGEWSNLPKEIKEQLRNAVKGLVEKAGKRSQQTNQWGSIPQEIQEVIMKLISHEIDWRSILKQFIGRCRTMDRNSTIKRINKKVPYLFPGYVRKYQANFACFIDQSGSMSDDDISLLFSELEGFADKTEIEVFHFDTEIDEKSRTTWKKGRPYPPAHRTRCGGTDFQAIANFCNKPENRGKWAGVVILTDGYAPAMGQIVGTRVIWVITETGTMEAVRQGDLAVQMKVNNDGQFKRY